MDSAWPLENSSRGPQLHGGGGTASFLDSVMNGRTLSAGLPQEGQQFFTGEQVPMLKDRRMPPPQPVTCHQAKAGTQETQAAQLDRILFSKLPSFANSRS